MNLSRNMLKCDFNYLVSNGITVDKSVNYTIKYPAFHHSIVIFMFTDVHTLQSPSRKEYSTINEAKVRRDAPPLKIKNTKDSDKEQVEGYIYAYNVPRLVPSLSSGSDNSSENDEETNVSNVINIYNNSPINAQENNGIANDELQKGDDVKEESNKCDKNKYETSIYQPPYETGTKNVEYAGIGDNPDYIQDRESGDTSTGVTHFRLDEETSKMAENDNDKSTYSPTSDRDADKLEYAGVGEKKETENTETDNIYSITKTNCHATIIKIG